MFDAIKNIICAQQKQTESRKIPFGWATVKCDIHEKSKEKLLFLAIHPKIKQINNFAADQSPEH